MLRSTFALISGLFAAMIVITATQVVAAKWLFPPPAGLDFKDSAAVNAFVAGMPPAAFAWILGGWLLGSFVGAAAAARIAERQQAIAAALVGCFVVFGTITNARSIEHPMWVLVLGVLLPIPLALLAARSFKKASPTPDK